ACPCVRTLRSRPPAQVSPRHDPPERRYRAGSLVGEMAPPRMADHGGRCLGGRYRLRAALGSGASAQVFLADDAALERQGAVKLLPPALAGDGSFLRRFQAEARAAAALTHPHIMAVYDWSEEEDSPFLV